VNDILPRHWCDPVAHPHDASRAVCGCGRRWIRLGDPNGIGLLMLRPERLWERVARWWRP